jgi:hypothetical protein
MPFLCGRHERVHRAPIPEPLVVGQWLLYEFLFIPRALAWTACQHIGVTWADISAAGLTLKERLGVRGLGAKRLVVGDGQIQLRGDLHPC